MNLKSLGSGFLKGVGSGVQKSTEVIESIPGSAGPTVIREIVGDKGRLQQMGSAFVQVAKGSRKALLAGPDNIITKEPTMRARYIPQFKGSVNLKTIHDVRVSNAPQMINLEKLRNLSRPVKRW